MELYPEIKPYNEFDLEVSDLHTIHVEESGNDKGQPVIFIHGGPGGGIEPVYRRYFNPEKWRIIIFICETVFLAFCGRNEGHKFD